ncbi:MAG: Transcriptional regulatory protein terminal [Rhodospirillales bacterium]|nr:Transcriptional regulatory protein terminal [Rhodospirillales bacterium]
MDGESFESICEGFTAFTLRRDKLLSLPNNQLVCTYSFNHALYREVIYDGLGQMRRASLHRAIGEQLEAIYPPNQRGDLAVRLAQHFSVVQDWPRALDYLRSALHVANGRSARRDAMALLDRAVDIVAKLDDHVRIPAEIEFLEWRAAIEAVAHDPGAQQTYAQIAQKARQYGDVDAQCRALLGLAYAVSWRDLAGSMRVVEQVLDLSAQQADPIQQDLTRITAHVRRLWGNGWNRAEGQACEEAVIRLRQHGDRLTTARANASFAMLCIISARYREAHDLVDEGYRVLREASHNLVEIDLARIAWMRHVGVPWSLVSLGEFGAARREFDAGIAIFEQNDDLVTARVVQSFRCVLLLHAMDYEGVLQATAPLLDLSADPMSLVLPTVRRQALVFSGLAEVGLGNNAAALRYFQMAERETALQAVHLDWYWRLQLEWGMVNLLIADGANVTALVRAKGLCDLVAQTDERTFQALAWEARAGAALACGENAEALESVANSLAACKDVDVPLAEWRVHATAASAYRAIGDEAAAAAHSNLGAAIRQRIAGTLPQNDPLRAKFEQRSELLASA